MRLGSIMGALVLPPTTSTRMLQRIERRRSLWGDEREGIGGINRRQGVARNGRYSEKVWFYFTIIGEWPDGIAWSLVENETEDNEKEREVEQRTIAKKKKSRYIILIVCMRRSRRRWECSAAFYFGLLSLSWSQGPFDGLAPMNLLYIQPASWTWNFVVVGDIVGKRMAEFFVNGIPIMRRVLWPLLGY